MENVQRSVIVVSSVVDRITALLDKWRSGLFLGALGVVKVHGVTLVGGGRAVTSIDDVSPALQRSQSAREGFLKNTQDGSAVHLPFYRFIKCRKLTRREINFLGLIQDET